MSGVGNRQCFHTPPSLNTVHRSAGRRKRRNRAAKRESLLSTKSDNAGCGSNGKDLDLGVTTYRATRSFPSFPPGPPQVALSQGVLQSVLRYQKGPTGNCIGIIRFYCQHWQQIKIPLLLALHTADMFFKALSVLLRDQHYLHLIIIIITNTCHSVFVISNAVKVLKESKKYFSLLSELLLISKRKIYIYIYIYIYTCN